MSVVLGVNAVFHDPAAALVIDGDIVAAAEEERFSRRKHGKDPVPFSTWELPVQAMRWCLASAGLTGRDVDAIGYSYDPYELALHDDVTADTWEALRTLFARRAPLFLRAEIPGLDPERVRFVPHHFAHAASASFAATREPSAFMVLDGRGERWSYLAGRADRDGLQPFARQELPHSLGFVYEELTEHLGYRRSSDEYKVMALASYGEPHLLPRFRELIVAADDGGFRTWPVPWEDLAPRGCGDGTLVPAHADLACAVQRRLEEVVVELAHWLHERAPTRLVALAGGVALNCVANSVLHQRGPFGDVWVQPAAGDSGTALGAALHVAHALGDQPVPMRTAALGRCFDDAFVEQTLRVARVPYSRPDDIARAAAEVLARDGVVGWFQGRSEFGPRALGRRSLLAHPGRPENLERLNDIKGREQFRPVAPMVLAERASEIFVDGPLPSPYMLFTHHVQEPWAARIPAVVHVDGTARIQTVDVTAEPLLHRCIAEFDRRTGLPVLVNTSFNTAGRPMVDAPQDALECFGSAPIDALAIGPFLVERAR